MLQVLEFCATSQDASFREISMTLIEYKIILKFK